MPESITFLSLFLFTFVTAGLVKGVTGMGLPTIAMGLLGLVMPPAAAAALLVVPSLATNVWQAVAGRGLLPLLRRLWPMLTCIVLATSVGSALLVRASPTISGFALGLALLLYALYALVSPALSVPAGLERWLSPVVGLVTGVITGATGVFAMPSAPYLQALTLSKDDLVQALGLSFTVSTLSLGAGLIGHGALDLQQLGLSAFAIVPALAGMWLGQLIRARISPQRFRQAFFGILAILGLQLTIRPWL